MTIARVMKKSFLAALSISILFAFSACTEEYAFTETEDGNLTNTSGTEYAHLANEGFLYYLGDLVFQGNVKGEAKISQHLGLPYPTGVFSIENAETDNILIRHAPDNEWFEIYRKASLPPFDFSVDNCIRLELVPRDGAVQTNGMPASCGGGITDKAVIAEFLSDIRSQPDPREAGLYDLVKKPDGMLENCYNYTIIYGFFEEEPNLAICMSITSYNDLAYSVSIDGEAHVLPEAWLAKLQTN